MDKKTEDKKAVILKLMNLLKYKYFHLNGNLVNITSDNRLFISGDIDFILKELSNQWACMHD